MIMMRAMVALALVAEEVEVEVEVEVTFDDKIPPLPRCSPIVFVVLLPLPPVPCLAGTLAPVPCLQDHVRG
jgi:hypothetical protein